MDESASREAIGRALLELLAEGRAISYGAAATRAGVSKGLVQHHFPDRPRLVRFAASTLADRLGARLRAVPSLATPGADPAAVLVDVLVALLPTTAPARLDEAAGRALFALALTDPETNRHYRDGRRAVDTLMSDLLTALTPGQGPEHVARTTRDLLGTLGELGTDLLLGELTAADAEALLRRRVEREVGAAATRSPAATAHPSAPRPR